MSVKEIFLKENEYYYFINHYSKYAYDKSRLDTALYYRESLKKDEASAILGIVS